MISLTTVKALLIKYCEGCKVLSIERHGKGRSWEVFRVRWVFKGEILPWTGSGSQGTEVAVRVKRASVGDTAPLDHWALPVYPGFIPTFITSVYRTDGKGLSFDVHRFVPGEQAGDLGGFPHLPALAGCLRLVHDYRQMGGPQPVFAGDWWRARVQATLDESIIYVRDHALYPDAELLGWLKLTLDLRELQPVRTSLLHGDLSPTNVLVPRDDPTQVAAIVDWDTAHYGDYLFDLASWACFHLPEHPDEVTRMLRLYHGIDGTDEQLHPATLRRFWVYAAVIATQRLASLHRLGTYPDLTRARSRITMAATHLSP